MKTLIVVLSILASSCVATLDHTPVPVGHPIGPVTASDAECQADDQCRITLHEDAALAEAYCADIPETGAYPQLCQARYELARTKLRVVAAEVEASNLPRRMKRQWVDDLRSKDAWLDTVGAMAVARKTDGGR
jgi:hypothetical protein